LVERLFNGPLTLVGIDHGFSFPLQYFERHGLPLDWPSFLDDFQRHWPTDEDIYVMRSASSELTPGNLSNCTARIVSALPEGFESTPIWWNSGDPNDARLDSEGMRVSNDG
jgi:hypothetical protein